MIFIFEGFWLLQCAEAGMNDPEELFFLFNASFGYWLVIAGVIMVLIAGKELPKTYEIESEKVEDQGTHRGGENTKANDEDLEYDSS